jgi:hypothetical protein
MFLAINTQWSPEVWGPPPDGVYVDGHFIISCEVSSVKKGLEICDRLRKRGLHFQVDIVDEYEIINYSLCLRKTYLLRLVQRKWKKLYEQWKRLLPKYIIEAQLTGKPVRLVLTNNYFHQGRSGR